MHRLTLFLSATLLLTAAVSQPAVALDADAVPSAIIAALDEKLEQSEKSSSSARKKLAINRAIRECDSLLKRHAKAPNRFEVLDVLFRSRQKLVKLENSAANRRALLQTCEQLAAAPNEYAAIRLDAELLLSQAKVARAGKDLKARADALRQLLSRYRDTDVEKKAVRIIMLMALEFGDAALISDVREVIAKRFAGDQELINFQRDKLAGQVFGAPFIGRFERADGKIVQFPMDGLGTTTTCYFWSQEGGGLEDLKELAIAWNAMEPEKANRLRFVSFNLDDLPDAGEGLLRELGLDWPALKLPGGRDNPIYKTYVRSDPRVLTISPTGYAAMTISGGRRTRGYERNLQSMTARSWTQPSYNQQIQSMLAGDFLVLDGTGKFDPAMPPEWQVAQVDQTGGVDPKPLVRAENSVPEATLAEIQACFVAPPVRFRLTVEEAKANYKKAAALCEQALKDHADASDLWLVRNRKIVALMGLWKLSGDVDVFASAVKEADSMTKAEHPPGVDQIAQFCLARSQLRAEDVDAAAALGKFVSPHGENPVAASAATIASLLALDMGNRQLHEKYRRLALDRQSDAATQWQANAFLVDRYQRYWMYHPPFVAGWTYGRRQGHFLSAGMPDEVRRKLDVELKTLVGDSLQFPQASDGKWTVIYLFAKAADISYVRRRIGYLESRPVDDVHVVAAVYDDDVDAVRSAVAELPDPKEFLTVTVPNGISNPFLNKLGVVIKEKAPSLVILRPDGSIASTMSGLTMSAQKEDVVRNTLEWHDEQAIDQALAEGSLEKARKLAFAFAPPEDPTSAGADNPKPKKPVKISATHLRGRAKVYFAMKQWQAAYDDIDEVYLEVNAKAGWLSMRTKDLDRTNQWKAKIQAALEQSESNK